MKKLKMNNPLKNVKLPKIKPNLSTFGIGLLALSHIAILALVLVSYRYYAIYPSIFVGVIAIVVILLIITDIFLFFGLNHKDKLLKIISIVLSVLIFISGTVGTFYFNRINSTVDDVLDGNKTKTELVNGIFISYKDDYKDLSDFAGKTIGLLNETSPGISSAAVKILDDAKIDYAPIYYNSYAEIFQDVVDKDIDIGLMLNGYRGLYENDENLNFSEYLDDIKDVYTFEETVTVDAKVSKKNIASEPFNVLLIGWSRTELGSSIGLADAIIVATINPQTYTVSMLSIARDSFVPIPCYGGDMDKINSGRSISRACFIETVENFIGREIDFYMEADYDAVIRIVNRIDGIDVYNPVEFTLDGTYVPQGYVHLDGVQALQFCRERHHMPNGDFDRQQHQKEVILEIIKKFIERGDVVFALDALKAAGDQLSTNLTVQQLTQLFNIVLNTENYTGLKTFDLLDFHQLRITGNGGLLYYSMAMRLPLWVYLVYKDSLNESVEHIAEVMDEKPVTKQDSGFEFSARSPYERAPFYSLEYPNTYVYTPDPMPPYWPTLQGLSQAEAMSWASANGVSLAVEIIEPDNPNYDQSQEGLVISQNVRYGSLVSEYRAGTITVMGNAELDPDKQVPNFVGSSYLSAVAWANSHGIYTNITFDTDAQGEIGKVLKQSPSSYTPIEKVDELKITVKAGIQEIRFDANGHGTVPTSMIQIMTGDKAIEFTNMSATDGYNFLGWYTEKTGGTRVYSTNDVEGYGNITLYAHWGCATHEWKVITPATCKDAGLQECTKCGHQEAIPKNNNHTWGEWANVDSPTCQHGTIQKRTCSVCGAEETNDLGDVAAHTWGDWSTTEGPTCDHGTIQTRTCSVCGNSETQDLGDKQTEGCDTGS